MKTKRSRVEWTFLVAIFLLVFKATGQSTNDPCDGLTAPLLLSPSGGTGPDMAIDSFGRAHIVWRGLDGYVYYALVDSNNIVVVPATLVYNTVLISSPRIAVDAAGDAHIVTSPGSAYDIIYMKVSNGVRVLLKAFSMNSPAFQNEQYYSPCIAINPLTQLPVIGAELHIEVNDTSVRYNNSISLMSLDASGNPVRSSRWNAYTLNNTLGPEYNAQLPNIVVDTLGQEHCVWQDKEASWTGNSIGYANDSQSSWSELASIRNVADLTGRPYIVRGNNGVLDTVWSTTDETVVWHEIDHNGQTVVGDTIVSQPIAQPSRPHIAAGFDTIIFGWADTQGGSNAQIFVNESISPPLERNVVCSPGATYSHALAIRGTNALVLVWQDNRSGSNQIFYRAQQTIFITSLRVLYPQAQVSPQDGIDAPIVPKADPNVLATASPLGFGVVADEVTPVLLGFTGIATNYTLEITNDAAAYTNGNLADHLHVLQNNSWAQTTNLTAASAGSTIAFAYLGGLTWTDFSNTPANGVTVTVNVHPAGSSSLAASTSFLVRPVPIVLVHGIADDATTWSYEFTNELTKYRPSDFIVPITYGRGSGPKVFPNANSWPNVTDPLDVLAPLLDEALKNQFETALSSNWAFTRYDVVGHSQGGVLARMLCQNISNSSFGRFVQNPVVSQANFYRGRFRRVITIGSPQNGTLIGWYVWKMRSSIDPADSGWFSQLQLGLFNVLAEVATDKFDPFGNSIAEINNPAYPVDQRIKFNCIQTAIAGGAPPIQTFNPFVAPGCYYISGLCFPTSLSGQSRGQVILPNGSDGVVDYDSEGGGSGTPRTQITDNNIAHADAPQIVGLTVPLFGVPAGQSQTTYLEVADIVGSLLNAPASRFGSFKLPSQLSPASEQTYENTLILGTAVMNLINLLPTPHIPSTNVNYSLQVPANLQNASPISWFAQVFGTNGLSTNGVTMQVNTNDSTQVGVSVDGSVQGQVLLYASYLATNGVVVFARPVVVVSYAPGTTLSGIELTPPAATLSVGDVLSTSIWGDYTNGTRCLLYIPTGQVSYSSSNTNVTLVDTNGTITLNSLGTATITANYQGLTAQTEIASVTPTVGNLFGSIATNGSFQLTFISSFGTTNIIQTSTNLTTWTSVATIYNTNGLIQFQDNAKIQMRFYRVMVQ